MQIHTLTLERQLQAGSCVQLQVLQIQLPTHLAPRHTSTSKQLLMECSKTIPAYYASYSYGVNQQESNQQRNIQPTDCPDHAQH